MECCNIVNEVKTHKIMQMWKKKKLLMSEISRFYNNEFFAWLVFRYNVKKSGLVLCINIIKTVTLLFEPKKLYFFRQYFYQLHGYEYYGKT